MSSRRFSSASVRTADPATLVANPPRSVRIPNRMVLDVLMLAEIGLIVAAAALAKLLYIAILLDSEQTLEPYILAGLAAGAITHYVFRSRGLHDPSAIHDWRRRSGDLLLSICLSFLILLALAFLFKVSSEYSRGWLLTWLVLTSAMLLVSRPLAAQLLTWLAATGYTARRIAIVGSGASSQSLAARFSEHPGVSVVGLFEDSADGDAGKPRLSDLISVGQRNQVDEIVIALADAPQQRTARLVEELSVLPVDVWLCPADFAMPIIGTSRLGALSLLQVKPKPIRDWGYLLKLALDYTLGALALFLFAPLMLLVAIAIRLDSRGPVIFKQRRHGYNHRVIDVYKFRTMTVAEDGERVDQARANDPRVTRIGKFLRRTSLDELPQLFNVLKGQMSLVGPRPHAVAHNQHYRERLERYANRHCVKPGLTGWAQISGFRGPTEDPEKMRKRVEMDLYYIENWSIWLDLKILAATPFVGFVHRNAL